MQYREQLEVLSADEWMCILWDGKHKIQINRSGCLVTSGFKTIWSAQRIIEEKPNMSPEVQKNTEQQTAYEGSLSTSWLEKEVQAKTKDLPQAKLRPTAIECAIKYLNLAGEGTVSHLEKAVWYIQQEIEMRKELHK